MIGFDAELYLRLFAERALLSGEQFSPWNNALVERARALAAAEVLSAECAQQVVDEYASARALRGAGPGLHRHRHRATGTHQPPEAKRIAFCGTRIEQPWGRFEFSHVVLTPTSVRLAVRMVAKTPHRHRHHSWHGGALQQAANSLSIADDRGSTVSAGFSGGGTDDEWTGQFTSGQPLATDTAWLEVLGERVPLTDPPAGVDVTIESLADLPPAERYLRHRMDGAPERHLNPDSIGEAVQALLDAGVLAADDDLIADVTAAGAAWRPGGPAFGHRRPPVAQGGAPAGPTGTVPIGAVTPEFDGVVGTICALESAEDGFQIAVEFDGPLLMQNPHDEEIAAAWLSYRARDDRGNEYRGATGEWGSTDGHQGGHVEFAPELDPDATRLEFVVTADRSRAVIGFPLVWGSA